MTDALSRRPLPHLYAVQYEQLVRDALREDLGRAGDLTSGAIVPAAAEVTAELLARRAGTIAGMEIAALAFRMVDARLKVLSSVADGDEVPAGTLLATVSGPARGLLSAERTALNFLGHLSGVATVTAQVARLVAPYGARVVCTRKTTPGLRALEKYAVRCGGGANHRFGLDDAVLIKDNHIAVAGGVSVAVERARAAVGHLVMIEVEVTTLDMLGEALDLGVTAVLLDNMTVDELRQAVAMAKGKATTEASGGITPANAAEVAATGVDLLSLGWITHSAPVLDVALDIK